MDIFGIITEPRRNCKSADDTPKYAQLVPFRHTDGSIPGVERHKLHAPRRALEPLAVPRAVIEEHADLAGAERFLAMHPDDLPVNKAWLHAVPGNAHAEVRVRRYLVADLDGVVIRPVEQLARTGGYRQPVERQRPHGAPLLRGRERRDDIPDMIETAELHKLTALGSVVPRSHLLTACVRTGKPASVMYFATSVWLYPAARRAAARRAPKLLSSMGVLLPVGLKSSIYNI